ncbi:HAMP domain-containing protein [Streptomyces sp. SKN60]|uniref:hybrid sensor histidine kinase/response regulator n=1 Tax=Streptomyces sp. SKN60 TaxID=2855506 RepID=UPI0022472BB4|nr:HAMP domain-containing protein [Streptomyces sp. SKN60]MCX2185296.1 HAMP domain-containing protein [Streptomyces sp. SKN60]
MAERTPAPHGEYGEHDGPHDGERDGHRPDSGSAEEGLRRLLAGLTAVRDGELSVRLPEGAEGVQGEIATVYNDMVDRLSLLTAEVTRVAGEVGGQGLLGGRAGAPRASGVWRELTTGVNTMADNLTSQVRSIAQVATAVARGDLTQKIRVDARGEILELKETINTMVDRLSSFAEEVTRVAREVGTEGKLGGQARVRGVSGTWKDLTDNVNSMADNLTNQVRNIAQVTTAVAQGDLTSRIDVSARGEILELKTTINTMVDQLSSFAAEVTRVAREVGTEGQLGGQAEVEGVSGTWMRLTENVNELAGNLTRQVRAIAEVTSAVAEGDLTRSITVEAPGEVGELRDNINAMVESLRATTRANEEQDWLQTNLARITALLQGTRGLPEIAELIMAEVPPLVSAQYGAFFLTADAPVGEHGAEQGGERGAGPVDVPAAESRAGPDLVMAASYGLPVAPGDPPRRFRTGEGLVGQAARDRRVLLVDPVPEGYATVSSAVGTGEPAALIVLPIVVEDQVLGAVELASLRPFGALQRDFLDRFVVSAGAVLSSLVANLRTDELLAQSRSLADELRSRTLELQARQRELQRSNAELQEQAELLAERNQDIESKNRVIEQARQELEARAQQLSRTSMYKSEFLANMSHELRTPLNSLLILARLLAQNPEGNLTEKQVDYAEVIHSAGSDLLQLINDILDLSKVEAGKMEVRREPFALSQLLEYLEATFGPVADQQGLDFGVSVAPDVPERLTTDEARLRQVLRNLLSNALKFTEVGEVSLTVERTPPDEVPAALRDGRPVLAFRVADTGVGIPADRLRHIFDAFQQGDGTTSREYGGTGLGLSISREVATLLGGTIEVESTPGRGSRFTFHLPEQAAPAAAGPAAPGPAARAETGTDEEAESAAPAPTPAPAAATVLIVDDDLRNVFALTQVLETHGLRVLTADGGRRAIELLAAHDEVRLVLMDVMMAGMDGYRAIEEIRRMPGRAGLPIIVVTAKAMPGDRARALEAGADDYVAKPVDEAELMVRIRRRLED